MPVDSKSFVPETFVNPVYPRSFPDPFVLKFRGEYFAYCTDFWRDRSVFGVLRSRDLVNWTEVGGALEKLVGDAPFYWAPEVVYANGKFYLYYSVGNEALMEMRVAVSDRPDGGFVDSGTKLTREDFAIDGHVFIDDDGQKYFFYATDFLAHSHIGTGTVVDRMKNFFTLEGNPRPVTRAKYDWQVYDPERKEKGGVRWHTVEGAFVLKRKGIYYEMFSGGNWQNITYGVSFAVTDNIERDEEWTQFSDGEKTFPILRTIPEQVVGPGHNSVARGVNNREFYCVYHRWTDHGRVLSIDRMDFVGTRIFIKGATTTPQIAPYKPTFADFFDGENLNENWEKSGDWKISDNEIVSDISAESRLICNSKAESFLCEFSLRAVEAANENSGFGFCLLDDDTENFQFSIFPASNEAAVYYTENGAAREEKFVLPKDFDPSAFHLLRVEKDGFFVKIQLDEASFRFEKLLEKSSNRIALAAENAAHAFSGFALTEGFEDLFDWQNGEIARHGWQKSPETSECRVAEGELIFSNKDKKEAVLTKGAAFENFEFAVNFRLDESFDDDAEYGFLVLNETAEEIARLTFTGEAGAFYLSTDDGAQKIVPPEKLAPENLAPENLRQFRFLKLNEKIFFQSEELDLGAFSISENKVKIGLFCRNSSVAFEMIRLTVL